LSRFTDQNLYQSTAWGKYKCTRGWTPDYFRAESNGSIVGMLQALVRLKPFRTVIAWCPGGPVGTREASSREAMQQLSSLLGARAMYCRSSFLRPRTDSDDQYLRANGWTRSNHAVGAVMTAVWNLAQTEEELLAGLNRNWRYSLRQAIKHELPVQQMTTPSIEELVDLCRTMNASKGLRSEFHASELAALLETLGDRAVGYGCRDSAGRLIAFHSCGIQGRRAWELVAATSEDGRRCGASFAVLWALILHCRRIGVTHYDLAGIDPERAPGVTSFKRWTGAQDVEWLGEWEWSTSSLLRHAVDLAARRRAGAVLP
jgi:lipid II:glycine glycyltransferase (peptidoglycan interpeptide bridge formation enzyme)